MSQRLCVVYYDVVVTRMLTPSKMLVTLLVIFSAISPFSADLIPP